MSLARKKHAKFRMEKQILKSTLTPATRHIGLTLATHLDRDGATWVGVETLATETGRCVRAVGAALKELREAGVIERSRRAGQPADKTLASVWIDPDLVRQPAADPAGLVRQPAADPVTQPAADPAPAGPSLTEQPNRTTHLSEWAERLPWIVERYPGPEPDPARVGAAWARIGRECIEGQGLDPDTVTANVLDHLAEAKAGKWAEASEPRFVQRLDNWLHEKSDANAFANPPEAVRLAAEAEAVAVEAAEPFAADYRLAADACNAHRWHEAIRLAWALEDRVPDEAYIMRNNLTAIIDQAKVAAWTG